MPEHFPHCCSLKDCLSQAKSCLWPSALQSTSYALARGHAHTHTHLLCCVEQMGHGTPNAWGQLSQSVCHQNKSEAKQRCYLNAEAKVENFGREGGGNFCINPKWEIAQSAKRTVFFFQLHNRSVDSTDVCISLSGKLHFISVVGR